MGLGKTFQTIVFIYTLLQNIGIPNSGIPIHLQQGRVLILCPASLVSNWKSEFAKWIPQDKTERVLSKIYTVERIKNAANRKKVLKSWSESKGVLILGYELFRMLLKSEPHVYFDIFNKTSALICDECHVLKSTDALISSLIKRVCFA